MPNNTDLISSQNIVPGPEEQESKLSFTSPTFKKPTIILGENDIADIISKNIVVPSNKGVLAKNFLEFYKLFMSNIESFNDVMEQKINDEILTPLNNTNDVIGANHQKLSDLIQHVQDNMITM